MAIETPETAQRAPAKGRILDTVHVLFYQNGIMNVGVDRIIAQSSVTKATFYKHYRSKDNLILAYVLHRRAEEESHVNSIIHDAASPRDAVLALLEGLTASLKKPDFRGCPFLNAVAEFSDPKHPVRQLIVEHRDWYNGMLFELMRGAGHPFPGDAADEFMLAKDGALAGGYASDRTAAGAAMSRVVTRLLAAPVAV
jgi:AcrR family transcriptional regulator